MKNIILLFFLAFSFARPVQAQVVPPDFLCVRGDTLFWDLPVNTCGPFVSYDVFFSANENGPFTLLDSVTDPAQDFFFHLNPSGQQWFYYLLSNFDCPGQMAISSDTLDNRPPEVSPIRSLGVVGSDVQIDWYASPSPEVHAYIIYRQTSTGVVPIDTVFGATTYLDTNADAGVQPESYFVNALDRCGNTSIFDQKHTTILMDATVNACEQAFSLSWNLYENWQNGIGSHEIWLWEMGSAPVPVDTIGPAATSFDVGGLTDGVTYCVNVRPVEAVTGARSSSNVMCLTADIVQPANALFLQNVSVLPNNDVELTYGWNTNAEISDVAVLAAAQNAGYQPTATFAPPAPLPAIDVFLDGNTAPGAGQVFYQIQVTDDCGDLQTSNYGSTIFLTGNGIPGNINLLNWTALDIENATVQGYDIYKIVSGSTNFLATVGVSTTSYEDAFDPTNLAEAEACYYVVAEAITTSPTGVDIPISSTSNVGCVEQAVRIFVPNALAPGGINQEFKPLIVLGNLSRYELRVFDRYGAEVFFSAEPDEGWRGKKGDRKLPQGVYVYQITVEETNGKVTLKKGTVFLIR